MKKDKSLDTGYINVPYIIAESGPPIVTMFEETRRKWIIRDRIKKLEKIKNKINGERNSKSI